MGRRVTRDLVFVSCLAAIAIACWLSFKRILDWYFIDVDTFPLIATGRIRSFAQLVRILTQPLMQGLMPNARFFRPLASISWGLDERLWGLHAFGYHLTDLALHAANAGLLFVFTRSAWRRLTPVPDTESRGVHAEATAVALGSALLFATSPAQAEFLPAIARRADLLAAFFGLLTLNGVLGFLRRPAGWRSALCALSCFLALASKEISILIPLSAGLLVLLGSEERCLRTRLRSSLGRTWPLLLATLLYLAWRVLVLHGLGGYAPMRGEPDWWLRFQRSLGFQFLLFAAPGHLNHASAVLSRLGQYWTAALLLALVFLVAGCVRALRRGAAVDRFFLWLLGSILGLVMLPLAVGMVTPRQMYLHTLFFAIANAWIGARLVRCAEFLLRASAGSTARAKNALVGALPSALWLVCVAGMLERSPLSGFNEGLDRWRRTGEISRHLLEGALPLLSSVPSGATVFLVDLPHDLDFGDEPAGWVQPETVLLLEHSVQGWVDLQLPDKHFDVIGLDYLRLGTAGPEALRSRVTFERERGILEVQIRRGAVAYFFPWSNAYGRHFYRGIFHGVFTRWASGAESGQGLRVQLAERYTHRPSVFLIYTGSGVTLRTFTSFDVES